MVRFHVNDWGLQIWKVGNISSKCMLGLDFENEKHEGIFLGQRKQDILQFFSGESKHYVIGRSVWDLQIPYRSDANIVYYLKCGCI